VVVVVVVLAGAGLLGQGIYNSRTAAHAPIVQVRDEREGRDGGV
jgi:hypothetical protein